MTFKEQLKAINACEEALNWLGNKTLQEAFATCKRADWMLWAYAKLYPDNLQELTLAKGHCVNTIRHLMKDDRSIAAVDAAISFGEGKISREELNAYAAAAHAAYAAAADAARAARATDAYAAAAARAAAAYAAYAAADATYAATYAAAAAYASADARAAAAYAAADAADAAATRVATRVAARKQSLKEQADICRKYLTI